MIFFPFTKYRINHHHKYRWIFTTSSGDTVLAKTELPSLPKPALNPFLPLISARDSIYKSVTHKVSEEVPLKISQLNWFQVLGQSEEM